jgi:hypothetical protein
MMKIKNYLGNVLCVVEAANLCGADLQGADLQYANLRAANLQGADLQGADLQYANLQYANLQGADLRAANLQGADLQDADLKYASLPNFQLPAGELVGYKKLANGTVAKLLIPTTARRTASLVGDKCRAEYAIVLEGRGESIHDNAFTYEFGKRVVPDSYDDDPRVECAPGIHFFRTFEAAEEYAS